jgi:hypothetical protein
MPPSHVGARAEAAVAAALVAAGRQVFVPLFSAHARVDLVMGDDAGRLHRVQCKTARLLGDVLFFATCSNTGGQREEYAGEVDLFGVHSPDLERCFLVPAEECPPRGCSLRLAPTRNGQTKRVRWAVDYVIGATLQLERPATATGSMAPAGVKPNTWP